MEVIKRDEAQEIADECALHAAQMLKGFGFTVPVIIKSFKKAITTVELYETAKNKER